MKPAHILIFIFLIIATSGQTVDAQHKTKHHDNTIKLYPDGPYIFYRNADSLNLIYIDTLLNLHNKIYAKNEINTIKVITNDKRHVFHVDLNRNELVREQSIIAPPKKLFVISDAHSNFNNFIEILQKATVIDSSLKWTYGKNGLVIIGDVFDRGKDATAIFWLIYKLEQEAVKKGGSLHYLIGNHDMMVMSGDLRYTHKKYLYLADTLNTDTLFKKAMIPYRNDTTHSTDTALSYSDMWNSNSLLGEWLRNKNSIQIIGRNLFVHAGISASMLDTLSSGRFGYEAYGLDSLNREISKYIDMATRPEGLSKFLTGREGPLWYRGMVYKEQKYNPASLNDINAVMKYFNVEHIIVGHSTFEKITFFHSGKIIAVDNENKKADKSHLSSGLAIDITNNKLSIIE